jgi:hypothetical protein
MHGIMVAGYSVSGLQGINETHPWVGIPLWVKAGLIVQSWVRKILVKNSPGRRAKSPIATPVSAHVCSALAHVTLPLGRRGAGAQAGRSTANDHKIFPAK